MFKLAIETYDEMKPMINQKSKDTFARLWNMLAEYSYANRAGKVGEVYARLRELETEKMGAKHFVVTAQALRALTLMAYAKLENGDQLKALVLKEYDAVALEEKHKALSAAKRVREAKEQRPSETGRGGKVRAADLADEEPEGARTR